MHSWAFFRVRIEPEFRLLLGPEGTAPLSEMDTRLAQLLASQDGCAVLYDACMEAIFTNPYDQPADAAEQLRQAITRLRQAVVVVGGDHVVVWEYPGTGYALKDCLR